LKIFLGDIHKTDTMMVYSMSFNQIYPVLRKLKATNLVRKG